MTEQERLDMFVAAALTGLLANPKTDPNATEWVGVYSLALGTEAKRQVDLINKFSAKDGA